ncbi:MAG: hypothetical protein B7Z43_07525 [Sphingomonas sp. 12-62-6]|nr:MAG: hypothetical protein B7Z43_07525 [Sphingomonas sp. 12-62-6]
MASPRNRRPGFSRRAQYGFFLGYVFAVAGSLVAAALLALSTFDPSTFAALRLALAEVTTPISTGVGVIGRGFISIPGAIGDHFALQQRNAALRKQIEDSNALLMRARALSYDNRRLRKLVDGPFRCDRIEALRSTIARIADDLIDDMERTQNFDLVVGLSRELPLRVISEMLGLPSELRRKTQAWMGSFADVSSVSSAAGVLPKIGKMMKLLREEFAMRRTDPGDGLVTELVQAEADGDRLTEDELLGMVFLLFIAGHETTTHLISTAMLDLLQHPDQLAMLRAESGLMANAVEELHRHNSPVQATKPRMARCDIDFHGVRLKQGDRVMGLLASANSDPAHFVDPERLDLKRPGVRHAGYGGGMHLCLGMHLARLETEVALERLLERWPSILLATPTDEIRWLPRPGMRGPLHLPLKVTGVTRRSTGGAGARDLGMAHQKG